MIPGKGSLPQTLSESENCAASPPLLSYRMKDNLSKPHVSQASPEYSTVAGATVLGPTDEQRAHRTSSRLIKRDKGCLTEELVGKS